MYHMGSIIKVAMITITLLIAITNATIVDAAEISLYWSGTITGITSFNDGAVPTGITPNSIISGNAIFDSSLYDSSRTITGSGMHGKEYQYASSLHQAINIESWEWAINGGNVGLNEYNSIWVAQALGSYSSSENHSFDSFPNYVGNFEYGIGLYDEDIPLQLFSSFNLQTLDLTEITNASGFLTTRLWDEQRNIIDGYYFTFDINQVSVTPVPLPPALFMFISGFFAVFFGSKHRSSNHT